MGIVIGKTILINNWKLFAPSIRAASLRDLGCPIKKILKRNIPLACALDQAKMSVITLLMLKSGVVKDNANQGYGVLYAMYIISGLPLMVVSAISLKFFKGTEFSAALKM